MLNASDRGCGRCVRDRERSFERTLERVQRERLHEVRRRLQFQRLRLGGIDAREQHGDVLRAEGAGDAQRRLFAGLDDRGVDVDVIDLAAEERHGLVPASLRTTMVSELGTYSVNAPFVVVVVVVVCANAGLDHKQLTASKAAPNAGTCIFI